MSAVPAMLKGRRGAVAALCVAGLLFGLVVIVPIAAAFAAQDGEIADSLQQLGYFRAEIAAKPLLESELRALNEKGASVPGVVEGDSTALAQARLQSEVKALVEARGGSVRSMQILPAAAQGGFELVAVQCDFSVPQARLGDLAYAVSTHAPYLFVDEASITAPLGEPDDLRKAEATLDMRWTVHGYRWRRSK